MKTNTPAPKDVQALLDIAAKYSDRGREGLQAWANEFVAAHLRAPGGLTIEVGTRIGGSAVLWGGLIELMYEAGRWPPLWTVDPYGSKPYVGGDSHGIQLPIYDRDVYATMKSNLSRCPFHAHWLMTSTSFFERLKGLSYWLPGEWAARGQSLDGSTIELPVGEEHFAGRDSASFILLDGEHSADSILFDILDAWHWLRKGGTIVVDNIDTDPKTLPRLRESLMNEYAKFVYDVQNRWLFIHRV